MNEVVLQGWKSIAAYLERDERTVRRWEKQHGLPIRRLANDRKSVVYALPSELDQWLLEPRSAQAQLGSSAEVFSPEADLPSAQRKLTSSKGLLFVATILLCTVCAVAAGLFFRATKTAKLLSKTHEASPSSADPDESVSEGELLLERRTPDSMNRAVEILTRRTQQAPVDAAAYASLAKALCLIREYSTTPPSVAYPPAEDAANRALKLDPDNAEAHAALGFIDFFWKWDAVAAERHFVRAITLAPASATAHQWYGSMMLHQGRKQEALKQLNQAQRLEPSSIAIMSTRAMALSISGQRAAADQILKKLEVDAPEAMPPYRTAAYLSLQEPLEIPAYLDQTEHFDRLRGDLKGVAEICRARKIYSAQGKDPMLRFFLTQERTLNKDGGHPSFRVARFEALLGEENAARDVTMAVKSHDDGAVALSIDPVFDRLRRQGKLDDALKLLPIPASTKK